MEKINGISFEDWAAASGNIADGMPTGQVLEILGVSDADWMEANQKWSMKLGELMEDDDIADKYDDIMDNPKVGKFANIEKQETFVEPETNSDDFKSVREFMQEANGYLESEPTKAIEIYKKAIALMETENDDDNEYNNLYAHYSILKYNIHQTGEENQSVAVEYAQKCLDILAPTLRAGAIFHFTDYGQFQEEVVRTATNTIAWRMMLNTDDKEKLEEALDIIEQGIDYADESMPPEYYMYLYDTKVRILLKMKENHNAYTWVYSILEDDPDFGDFQDIKNSTDYKNWLVSDEFKKWEEEEE